MGMSERVTWIELAVLPSVAAVYLSIVLSRAASAPVAEISWIAPLVWCAGAVAVGIIVLTILSYIAEAIAKGGEEPEGGEDIRDKQIDMLGQYAARHVTALAGGAVILECALRVDPFWIATTMFLAGILGAIVTCIVKLRAYRKGF